MTHSEGRSDNAELKEELAIFQQARDQLHYDKPIAEISKVAKSLSCEPTPILERKTLGSCGKAATKSLELEDLPIQGYVKAWSKIQGDKNLEISVLEHITSPFLMGPKTKNTVSVLKLVR